MAAFADLRSSLERLKKAEAEKLEQKSEWPPREEDGARYFDALELVRRVLMAQDLLFLSRQVTYHVAASADLPSAWADANQIHYVFSKLVEHLVRRAARSSRISISLSSFALRSGPGVEISFASLDRNLAESDRNAFVAELFQGAPDSLSGVALSDCRQVVMRQHGQLWVDFPKPDRPVYHVVLPVSEEAAAAVPLAQQTFKYDIAISNYADLRKRFGIRKSHSLVSQIEHYVRSLVRYPIDVVLALSDKGVITTIYETQRGTAQTVASRISQRLGSETFRIGKRQVDLAFSYHLSPMSNSNTERARQ
ncbi:MAG TPA: hypothetical protein PLZ86_02760 [bacterium]|nr:hypothetical protein [bacterium]